MDLSRGALVGHLLRGPVRFVLAMAVLAFAAGGSSEIDLHAPSRREAVATSLAKDGYQLDTDDVLFLSQNRDSLPPFRDSTVLVRARHGAEPHDLYLAFAELSPEGVVLALSEPTPLSRTQGVAESRPLRLGDDVVAYTTVIDGTTTGIHILDFGGRDPGTYSEFTRLERLQTAITNVQETGHKNGINHFSYLFDPPVDQISLARVRDDLLSIDADGHAIRIEPKTGKVLEGETWVRPNHEEKARPSAIVQWSVNRVRAISWFGEERMQYVKAIAFTAKDWIDRTFGYHETPSEQDIKDELGDLNGGEPAQASFTNPEIGWPPAPLTPIFKATVPGEGAWIALDRDPFLKRTPGLPPPFMTTFIRTDKERPDTRIYITMWDPRQIALHMEAGTVEPTSATGNAGPGLIPRKAEILKRAVAGFNGGFQALHGEYGMMANGTLYLPPKPYAASIMELRDGSTATGSWPKSSEVPSEILSFRQNMTALVERGKFNPWGRNWWGGTPETWTDRIHTTRSGVCRTKENFVGYFWGNGISHEVLAQAMIAANCDYGVHLDMNPGLAGFEFYRVEPASAFTPIGRPLQRDWEYEGSLKDFPDLRVRARRMIKGMSHVNFPAWIHRTARDFFYLTERPLLPAADLGSGAEADAKDEGKWVTKGLPQQGFPYSIATTWRKSKTQPGIQFRLLDVDPRMVRGAPKAKAGDSDAELSTVVSFAESGTGAIERDAGSVRKTVDRLYLSLSDATFRIGTEQEVLLLAEGSRLTDAVISIALACINGEDGMLRWIEQGGTEKPTALATREMDQILGDRGCGERIALERRALLGGELSLFGMRPAKAPQGAAVLVRGSGPSAKAMFEDTPIVSYNVWHTLQAQRVRYFPKPKKPTTVNSSTPETPAPPASAAGKPSGKPPGN